MASLRDGLAVAFGTDEEKAAAGERIARERAEAAAAPPSRDDQKIEDRRRYASGLARAFGVPDPYTGELDGDGDQGDG